MKPFWLIVLINLLTTTSLLAQWSGTNPIYYNSGNVGIGTSNPVNRLHVESNNPILSTGYGSGFKFRDWTTSQDWHWYALDNSARLHQVGNGALSDRLVITSSGNVGIGNTAPPYKLSVSGDIYSRGHMFLYAFEGESNSGTAYLQARNNNVSQTNIDLRLRTQSAGQVVDVMHLNSLGNVGIGTINPGSFKLAVEGKIGAQEVEVRVPGSGWADFVFKPTYRLKPLAEVERYIQRWGHLPDIPSKQEVEAKGVALGEMNARLLQKIEELTLHMIRQEKEIKALKQHYIRKK